MSKLVWDAIGERYYETGVSKGVLYPRAAGGTYPKGVAWNGLTAVNESPSGAESNPIYADNIEYLNLLSAEKFAGTIEAYTYPDEFAECDGSAELSVGVVIGQQTRKVFGLSYKTLFGNDEDGTDHGYKVHILYGALAAPSEKAYATVNESPEAITFSWEINCTPVEITGFKPSASITISSTKVDPAKLATLEDILYGTIGTDPRLPLPDEIATLFGSATPGALALSSIVPDDDTTGITVSADIIMTFNNRIIRESIIVTSAAGVLVAGTKTWDANKKVLTFNPTSNLSANTEYIVTIGGVMDVYNQSLAPLVKNFKTA